MDNLKPEGIPEPTCLDSAYERQAVYVGLNKTPVFNENKLYLEWMQKNNVVYTIGKKNEKP